MARSYAKVYLSIWSDTSSPDDFRRLPRDAQLLYLMLLSNPKMNAAGVVACQPRKWAGYSADTTAADIEHALDVLSERRFIITDRDTDEVLIRSFIRHDRGYRNKFLRKSIESAVQTIESPHLRDLAALELASVQVEDSEQESYEDPSDENSEDPEQDTTEANYRLQTSTSPSDEHLHPRVSSSSVLKSVPAPASDDDDDEIINKIITRAAHRLAEANGATNRTGYAATCAAELATERQEIQAMLNAKPFLRATPEDAAKSYLARRGRQGGAA